MNNKKILMYNGGTERYKGCSNPDCLVTGQLYEIIREEDLNFQTNYTLKGIEGEFNSVWFSEPTSYFAYSDTVPALGTSLTDFIRFEGIHTKSVKHSSIVRYIEPITSDIYKVYTKSTLYIVKVLSES